MRKVKFSQSFRIDIGIIVHEALEAALRAYYNTDYAISIKDILYVIDTKVDQYAEANKPKLPEVQYENFTYDISEDLVEWEQTVNTARIIAKRTIVYLDVPNKWRTATIQWEGETVPLIEFRFTYPLVEDRDIVGKLDWVATSLEDGHTYLIDWKTRKAFTSDFEVAGEDMNLQLSIYQYVLNSMGVDTFGTITYQIRSTVPATPEVTKQGHVSKAKIATDYTTYMQALIDNNEDLDEYEEVLGRIQQDEYWWLPVKIIRGKIELYNRWETVQKIARQMIATTDPIKYESPRCTYCPFFRLCLGEDRGLDVENLKEISYTISDYRH